MMYILLLMALFAFPESPVEPFEYSLDMTSRPTARFFGKDDRRETFDILFKAASRSGRSARDPAYYTYAQVSLDSTGVHVVAKEQFAVATQEELLQPQPVRLPNNGFDFRLRTLVIPANGVLPLHIHFKNHTDEFEFRHDSKGLSLVEVKSKFGTVNAHLPLRFKIVRAADERTSYECSPLGITAYEGGKQKWNRDYAINKEPDSLKVVGETLYVSTTAGSSLYLLKKDGTLLTQHDKLLGGVDPVAECISAGSELAKVPLNDRIGRQFSNYYKTGVILDDRRVIPLLIQSVGLGFGLSDKMLAIAGLEKFNGNAKPWNSCFDVGGNRLYKHIGMARVFPQSANDAECDRWREVFKGELRIVPIVEAP